MPRDPAQLMSDVAFLDGVGATERDVMIGVNNEEGALLLVVNDVLAASGRSQADRDRFREFLQVSERKDKGIAYFLCGLMCRSTWIHESDAELICVRVFFFFFFLSVVLAYCVMLQAFICYCSFVGCF